MPLFNPPVIIQDAGTTQGTVNTINFTGSVSATVSGAVATVNITGSGGSSITQIEVNFGTIPTRSKTFVITDATVSPSTPLIVTQSGAAATGRQADENEMDPITFSATPGSGQFILIASALNGPVVGNYRVNYIVG